METPAGSPTVLSEIWFVYSGLVYFTKLSPCGLQIIIYGLADDVT